MNSFYKRRRIYFLFAFLISFIQANPPSLKPTNQPGDPKIIGAMKEVMWEGRLSAQIDIDTLSDKRHLYGLGPVEFLAGEILILDGTGYKSEVLSDTSMKVTETLKIKAPFFGYANIGKWTVTSLPDSVTTLPQLEAYLNIAPKKRARPFFFKITAVADSANIHVVNIPKGSKVSSPADAHLGQKDFTIRGEKFDLLGFFSTEHQAIFTHHDTFVHAHLITGDRKRMGHLDEIAIRKGTGRLFLPE
ncbi:MAG: alpha-acetolactate decarboxylase [Fibrobacteres bacterium]|nr:alpha-acetolactate decarboxylase [Fibrobacterota bacterium]